MLMGEYRHNLDSKNRMIMPSKFRDELGDTFVVTAGLDECLTVYTNDQWQKLVEQLGALPSTNKEARKYTRFIMSKAVECEVDTQGRFQLPANLISFASIAKKCVVIGAATHVEIWSEENWDAYDSEASEAFETAAESLTEFFR